MSTSLRTNKKFDAHAHRQPTKPQDMIAVRWSQALIVLLLFGSLLLFNQFAIDWILPLPSSVDARRDRHSKYDSLRAVVLGQGASVVANDNNNNNNDDDDYENGNENLNVNVKSSNDVKSSIANLLTLQDNSDDDNDEQTKATRLSKSMPATTTTTTTTTVATTTTSTPKSWRVVRPRAADRSSHELHVPNEFHSAELMTVDVFVRAENPTEVKLTSSNNNRGSMLESVLLLNFFVCVFSFSRHARRSCSSTSAAPGAYCRPTCSRSRNVAHCRRAGGVRCAVCITSGVRRRWMRSMSTSRVACSNATAQSSSTAQVNMIRKTMNHVFSCFAFNVLFVDIVNYTFFRSIASSSSSVLVFQ